MIGINVPISSAGTTQRVIQCSNLHAGAKLNAQTKSTYLLNCRASRTDTKDCIKMLVYKSCTAAWRIHLQNNKNVFHVKFRNAVCLTENE